MSTHPELQIQTWLKEERVPGHVVVERIAKILRDSELPFSHRRLYMNYLINSGHFHLAFQTFPRLFRTKAPVPWSHYVWLLNEHGLKPPPEVLESLFKGARKQNLVAELAICKAGDHWDERFIETRRHVDRQRHEDLHRKREALWEKVQFLRNQRMIDEEKKVLQKMLRMFPDDHDIRHELEDFEQRWARDILAQRSSTALPSDRYEITLPELSEEEQACADAILAGFQSIVEKRPDLAYDLSMGLFFMELYAHALELITLAPATQPVDWFHAELLLLNRRFVDGLSHVGHLELKYVNDPETTFAASYLRAKALWGLGQSLAAIEIVRSILHVRPNYRSASALLAEWSEGASA